MTTTMVDSPSQASSWEESNLPPATEEEGQLPSDNTELLNPPEKVCPACGEEVVREPGSRGRVPKYHPECKPQRGAGKTQGPRPVRVTSKERQMAEEIEETIDRAHRSLKKAVALISLADPYDAFVLHVNIPDLLDNLRTVLYRWPWLREQAGNASAGASVLGLLITAGTIVLPIMAHHNLIPSKKIAPLLLSIPMFMSRLQTRMASADSEEAMTDELMARIREQAKKAEEARQRVQSATESVSHSQR